MILSKIIHGVKSTVTRQINKTHCKGGKSAVPTIWQRSFHDHIIRNDKSLNNIRQYIHTNPATWDKDIENPNNMGKEIDSI